MSDSTRHVEQTRLNGVVLGEADRRLCALVGEHYGVTIAQLQLASGIWGSGVTVSPRAIRLRMDRWRRRGLVFVVRRHGVNFVSLTNAGYAFAGLSYPLWRASESRIAHVRAVTDFRLWYEWDRSRVSESGSWVSERCLYRERGGANWHLHDAELARAGRSTRLGVEVELTLKTPTTARYTEVLSNLAPHIEGVMYVCAPSIVDQVTRSTSRCRPRNISVWVRALPSLGALGSRPRDMP